MWWLLRVFGHEQAAVLDGGWGAWQAAGHPVCPRRCGYPPASFVPHPRAGLLVGKGQVQAAIDDPQVVLVNALGRRQHRGEVKEYVRRGHIPGSLNVTAWEILDRDTGCYRPEPELRQKIADLKVSLSPPIGSSPTAGPGPQQPASPTSWSDSATRTSPSTTVASSSGAQTVPSPYRPERDLTGSRELGSARTEGELAHRHVRALPRNPNDYAERCVTSPPVDAPRPGVAHCGAGR